jgi:hypothetical protein
MVVTFLRLSLIKLVIIIISAIFIPIGYFSLGVILDYHSMSVIYQIGSLVFIPGIHLLEFLDKKELIPGIFLWPILILIQLVFYYLYVCLVHLIVIIFKKTGYF